MASQETTNSTKELKMKKEFLAEILGCILLLTFVGVLVIVLLAQ